MATKTDKYIAEKTTAKNIINTAVKLINKGENPNVAKVMANLVNANPELINKINLLKQINVLDAATKTYIYSIQLTDNALDVEPKINAIWELLTSAGIISDGAEEAIAAADKKQNTTDVNDDIIQNASAVLNKLLVK